MDKRRNRRLIAGVVALALGLFAATLYAARGRRVAIDTLPFFWENDITVEFAADAAGGNGWAFQGPLPTPTPVQLPVGMILKVGDEKFNRVWINANGFVSLTLDENGTLTGEPWEFQAPGATSFADVPDVVNVIAPFYADAVTRTPAADCPVGIVEGFFLSSNCDVVYALLDGDKEPDVEGNLPPFWKGMRVTWGYGDENQTGLPQQDGALDIKNRFQLKLIDRSGALAGATGNGDFDIQFNYDDLPWQSVNTLVGLKVAGVTMDFSRLLAKSFRTDLRTTPNTCQDTTDPFFDRNTLLACNSITIEVRNGIPKLATYSADVSVQLLAGGVGTLRTAETFPMGVQIFNSDDHEATNVKATIQLPNDTTIISAPQGTTCAPSTASAICNFGSIDKNGTKTVVLNLRSMEDGQRTYSARISADQYDYDPSHDEFSLALNLEPSADVAMGTCTPPASLTQGNTATVQCNVTNNGPQNATQVAVAIDLPAILTFVSGSDCTASGARVTCTTATLAFGATKTFSLTVNAASTGSGSVSAMVDAPQNDPDEDNNDAAGSVTVSAVVVTPPPTTPPKKGGGSLSIWLLMSLALLAKRQRSAVTWRTA